MSMCITRFLQNYFKKFILKIVFMTFPYRNIRLIKVNKNLSVVPRCPGHVPYLPYPRYATVWA